MSESSSSLLCVIFDINPLAWGLKTLLEAHANGENNQRQETIVQGLDATLTFINSFLLMTHGNQVAVVGVHPEASGIVNLISALAHRKIRGLNETWPKFLPKHDLSWKFDSQPIKYYRNKWRFWRDFCQFSFVRTPLPNSAQNVIVSFRMFWFYWW